ncbi:hypothetical protein ACWFR1_28945 [Streptomyces sp. NPDC055103]
MSLSSPIPVLRGSGGAVLQSEGDALVLSRAAEEARIPLQAVRQIRAEGRAVAVELTAPAGKAPAVHRVEGVSEAAATMFADAVNATLPAHAGEAGEIDGATLVTVRALTESDKDARKRRLKRWTWVAALVIVAVTVTVGILGPAVLAIAFLVTAPVGVTLAGFGAFATKMAYDEWYLPRYGITVEAVRYENTSDLFGRSGNYMYTDLHGANRRVYEKGSAATVQVAYHPKKPGTVTVTYARLSKTWHTAFALGLLLFGLGICAGDIVMAIGAVQGMYDEYAITPGG